MNEHHRLRLTRQRTQRIIDWIKPHVFAHKQSLGAFNYTQLESPRHHVNGLDVKGETVEPESYWGAWTTNFALETEFSIEPSTFRHPALHLPLGETGDIFSHPECLVYIDGEAIGSADRHHHELPVPNRFIDGQKHRLTLTGWTGLSGWPHDPNTKTRLFMRTCRLIEIDVPLRNFVRRLELVMETISMVGHEPDLEDRLFDCLEAALKRLDTRHPLTDGRLTASAQIADRELRENLKACGDPLDVKLHAVGHAHMDVAYLWRIEQTRAKLGRTFSNALRLMVRDPDYCFSQSQPQLYRYLEDDYPMLFQRIKTRVKEGRWECTGGMWVEPDCNVPSGESLVRQLLLGREYYRSRFGEVDSPVLFLPDTFGFCPQLPQLMKGAGLEWFMTNKTNWNQYNRLPAQTFRWQGLDDSEVLAQVFTTPRTVQYLPYPTTYKAELSGFEVLGTWENYEHKDLHNELPIAFGYGDGGGGPTQALIDRARLLQDMPGMPKVEFSRLDRFFESLEPKREQLPAFQGELYLELHRGTYTSQAAIKRRNRELEQRLQNMEFWASWCSLNGRDGYPHNSFQKCWELLCLNQFHDILPGTSIPEVFDDAHADYDKIEQILAAIEERLAPFTQQLVGGSMWVNGNAQAQTVVQSSDALDGHVVQPSAEGYLVAGYLPAMSVAPLQPRAVGQLTLEPLPSGWRLSNTQLIAEIDNGGRVTRFESEGRSLLKAPGNVFQAFDDRPVCWDAWDIDIYFEDHQTDLDTHVSIEVVAQGPLEIRLRLTRAWRASLIRQDVVLRVDEPLLRFETQVYWGEAETLLKVAFPTVVESDEAHYETQFGWHSRPAHRRTAQAAAQFEVPAQRWGALWDEQGGMALLNNCKYGYDANEGTLRLTLIKSSTSPSPKADQGEHAFTYAIMATQGDAIALSEAGDGLNQTARAVSGVGGGAVLKQFPRWPSELRLSSIKQAQDGSGYIMRLHNQTQQPVSWRTDMPICEVNLLEQPQAQATTRFEFKPFEIKTVWLDPSLIPQSS